MRLLSLVLVSCCACAGRQKPTPWYEFVGHADSRTVRQTVHGTLVGFVEPQGSMAWLGVPYAQPPLGPLRWKAPRPPSPWEGPREATRYGPLCPQLNGLLAGGVTDADVAGSEDCLTLNVVTPPFTAEQAARERQLGRGAARAAHRRRTREGQG